MQSALTGEITRNIEYTLVRQDGSRFPAEVSASAITDDAGYSQALIAVARDITARKKIEHEAQRRLSETLLLNRVIAAATSALETKAVLSAICRELAHAFDLPQAACALLDADGAHLTVVAEYCARAGPPQ